MEPSQLATKIAHNYARHDPGIDFRAEKFSVNDLARGIDAEFEHADVTGRDPDMTAKIAIAHLKERPDYYDGLEVIEEAPPGYWRTNKVDYASGFAYANWKILLIIVLIIIICVISYDACIQPFYSYIDTK